MAKVQTINMDMKTITSNLYIEVKLIGLKKFKIRRIIAIFLLKIIAIISPIKVELKKYEPKNRSNN